MIFGIILFLIIAILVMLFFESTRNWLKRFFDLCWKIVLVMVIVLAIAMGIIYLGKKIVVSIGIFAAIGLFLVLVFIFK